MELYLVQHAESRPREEDPDRSLTEAGAAAGRRMAEWAAERGIAVEQIRHSGKTRAEQTARILGEALDPRSGVVAMPGINPLDDPAPVAEQLRAEQASVALVGHLPFLGRLAGLLLAGDPEPQVVAFENAGLVCLERTEAAWSLRWAVVPRLLEAG